MSLCKRGAALFWKWNPNTLGAYTCPSGSLKKFTVTLSTTHSPCLPRSPTRSIRQVYGDFPFTIHFVGSCLEGLSKITKISISIVGVATDIRNANVCNNVSNLDEPFCTIAYIPRMCVRVLARSQAIFTKKEV